MNRLLKLLEKRVLFAVAAVLAAAWVGTRVGNSTLSRVDLMLHPPAPSDSILSAGMDKEIEARQSAKLRALHRSVSAEIAASAAKGFPVERFQILADGALELDAPASRAVAFERLNKLRLAIPRGRENFRPASADDLNPDTLETPRPRTRRRR